MNYRHIYLHSFFLKTGHKKFKKTHREWIISLKHQLLINLQNIWKKIISINICKEWHLCIINFLTNISKLIYEQKKLPLADDAVEATFVGTFIPIVVVTAIDAFGVVMATGFVVMLTDCVMSVIPTKVHCIDELYYKSFCGVWINEWQYITYKIYRIFYKTFLQSPVTLDRYRVLMANERNLPYPHMGENLWKLRLYCNQSGFFLEIVLFRQILLKTNQFLKIT